MKKIALLMIFLFLSCCRKIPSNKSDNILSVPLSGEVSTLDPADSYDTISASVVYQCYETLFEYHYLKRPYIVKPLLASAMPEIKDGGKTYIIKIRKNIRYHEDAAFLGKPRMVKAEDFITQIKRLAFIPTKSNGAWLFENKIIGFNKFRDLVGSDFKKFKTTNIDGIMAPDDHTLVIKLHEPYPQLLFNLAMTFTAPMPLEVVTMYKNILNDRIVGTGPFELESWVLMSALKLKRFKYYHDEFYPAEGDRFANSNGLLKDAGAKLPFLDGIHFKVMQEAQTRWINFMRGKVDLLTKIPKDNYDIAIGSDRKINKELKDKKIELRVSPTLTYWWLAFNMDDPIFGKNMNLRMAIAHAIDMKSYIQLFTNNIAQKANSIFPPTVPGYDPSTQLPFKYDVAIAKQYLAQAGYKNGVGLGAINFDTRGVSTTHRQQAEMIKRSLDKIGIEVNIILNTFPHFLQKVRSGKVQFWQDGWAMDYPDAENVLQLLASKNSPPGPNATSFNDREFDKLFRQLKRMEEGAPKHQLMKKIEIVVNKQLPWVMQYYARNYILIKNSLKNYRQSDIIQNHYKYLRLD